MKRQWILTAGLMTALLLFAAACDDGVDDWNSSAKIVGYVYTDMSQQRGVEGVQVILESDPDADNPYEGPDRWTTTDRNGHFEGAVFLGNKESEYVYIADLTVGYFWHGKSFSWSGGISVSPGSVFTLPPVDTSMFASYAGGGQ
ncbi:hypothetical protein EHM69_05600 [candidate division KSB1 bacterium]|nr:MAG: hypothetical protein EHM69_05600 [candidate division KSB1 bacterium]